MAIINRKNHPQFGPTAINYICKTLGLHGDSSDSSSTMHIYHNGYGREHHVMIFHSTKKYSLISNLGVFVADYSSGEQIEIMNEEIRDYAHLKEFVKLAKEFL